MEYLQSFTYEPVYAVPKVDSAIYHAIVKMYSLSLSRKPEIIIGYDRIKLRWMKPDGKGGLIPK